MHHFVRVEFSRFKALRAFSIDIKHFNILVGPNNAGKSTILAAFRILSAAMRRAGSRKPTLIRGPQGWVLGYEVDLTQISIAEENIFYNYDDSGDAAVIFTISNANKLTLYFPERGLCYLIADTTSKPVQDPTTFKRQFDCPIGFVPILGPVEHHEPLFEKEAARLALINYGAARNFRNIWYHYPEKFDEFRLALQNSWPGMDIEKPEIDTSYGKPRLHMFCPEHRKPRELFWSGFGFQVWCQMPTHIIQGGNTSLFLIDEPDIYLHSELQRQLIGLLRTMGPDILIATHSTAIITEVEAEDILLVSKERRSARRIKNSSQIGDIFRLLGSNVNPILTQLAKTRRVVFVEGKDFQILGKFARKLGAVGVGNRRDFAVVPVEGFNPERVKNLKAGMEETLGSKILATLILDRDFRCDDECAQIKEECLGFCKFVLIHQRKEIENFLLVPSAIDRAAEQRLIDKSKRLGTGIHYGKIAEHTLIQFAKIKKPISNLNLFPKGSVLNDPSRRGVIKRILTGKFWTLSIRDGRRRMACLARFPARMP